MLLQRYGAMSLPLLRLKQIGVSVPPCSEDPWLIFMLLFSKDTNKTV